VQAWQAIMLQQEEIKELSIVFGVEARRAGEKRIAELRTSEQALRARFTPEFEAYQKPMTKRVSTLRDEVFRLRERDSAANVDKANPRIAEGQAEVDAIDGKVRTLDEMRKMMSDRLSGMPTTTTLLGIDTRDAEQAKLVEKYPTVIEARKRVRDCEVDIETLQKSSTPPDANAARRIAATEKLLAKATSALAAEVAKVSKVQTDEIAKLKKKLEGCEKQIAETEKRKRPPSDRLTTERAELQSSLASLEKAVATITKLAGTTPVPPPVAK
jgi:predicted  nucleic acid-binding Zn-ribbon protein